MPSRFTIKSQELLGFPTVVSEASQIQQIDGDKIDCINAEVDSNPGHNNNKTGRFNHKDPTPVLTIKDGNAIIDCIKFEEQIAFQHPLFKNQKIEQPPARSKGVSESMRGSTNVLSAWLKRKLCPEGTIPVRRHDKTKTFVKRGTPFSSRAGHKVPMPQTTFSGQNHEEASNSGQNHEEASHSGHQT